MNRSILGNRCKVLQLTQNSYCDARNSFTDGARVVFWLAGVEVPVRVAPLESATMKSLVLTALALGTAGVVAAQQPLLVPTPPAASAPTVFEPQLFQPSAPAQISRPTAFEQIPVAPSLMPAPIPDPAYGPTIPYDQVFLPPAPVVGPALPLYQNVRVRQTRNMHPQAVPTLVAIRNPSFGGSCVYVEVCVPPCGPGQVLCYRRGDRIRLDYGKYSVDIVTTRRGVVVIDYND